MDIREDVGPQVLDYLFTNLRIDPEWCVRESRKLTWWGHRLAQKVWAEPVRMDEGYAVVRVHAEIDESVPGIVGGERRFGSFYATSC